MRARITDFPQTGCPSGPFQRVWCVCALLCLLSGGAAGTAPSLRPDAFYGPLADVFEGDKRYVISREAGRPSMYLPLSTLWYANEVEVDSIGVKYTRQMAGRPLGPPVRLSLDAHLEAPYEREVGQLWHDKVRRDFRAKSVESRRKGNRRLYWNMPFRTRSRTLRRIIGTEGPSLSLSGSHTTTISGKSDWTSGEVRTISSRPSKFPTLGMDQESKFTVEGKVGELINIRISQDTQNVGLGLQDALANQIKIDYKSDDEDAIIQEIQAGNTTLELPGTRFVSFRQRLKGLFGFRTKGNVGPMTFTAIASHEKSKGNRRSLQGGAVADTVTVRDYQFLRNKIFFLDEFYRANLTDFRQVSQRALIAPEDFIDPSFLQVFLNDFNTINDQEKRAREGIALVDLDGSLRDESGWIERGTWHQLDPDNDYSLLDGGGYIILQRPVQDRHALAVSYRTAGGTQVGNTQGDTLRLKLIKAQDARPDFPTWDLEWKNVYSITNSFSQGKRFDRSTIDVQVLKEVSGREPTASQNGTSYLQIMGLDEHGQSLTDPPDRLIDATYPGLFEFEGLLIFPDQTPFAPQDPKFKDKLKDPVPAIYTSAQQRDQVEASSYIINVVSSSGQAKIRLPFGVNPNSVEVRLNGQQLEFGRDFNVGFSGDLTFLSEQSSRAAADPGADIDITFETEDLFGGGQQKTLLGLRTDYEFWDGDGRIGGTLLYNNERSNERRIRVGNEPARTIVWDMDLRTQMKAPMLTRVVDAFPFIKTAAPSDLTLQAEIAQSRPNLNTKGKAFIDDFEGSEQPTLISVVRTRWTPASLPTDAAFSAENRGRLVWFNPFDKVSRLDIWPGEEEQLDVNNNRTDVLVLQLEPRPEPVESWAGVMTAFSAVNDFSRSKFLEVWLRGEAGFLHVDLGDLSEDLDADGFLDTEDKPLGGLSTGNGVVDADEDVGLDGRSNAEEVVSYLGLAVQQGQLAEADTAGLDEAGRKGLFARVYPGRNPDDPEDDDWAFNNRRRDYSRINGTEGNGPESNNARPDTEDLNNDGTLNQRNDYYHYTIDLALDPHVPGTHSDAGWRLFRLPLYEDVERRGNPDSTRIEYARLIFTNAMASTDSQTVVEIAQMEVVGNQWQEDAVVALDEAFPVSEDEGLNVTTVGTRENEGYEPPPGVKRRRSSTSRRRESEQSLVLAYTNIDAGHQASVTRILTSEQNYTKYTRLRMFAHGDSLADYLAQQDSSAMQLFLRFGRDSTNYYEFATPLFPGWDGLQAGWSGNEIDIDLVLMAQLKNVLLNAPPDSAGQVPDVLDTVITRVGLRDSEPAVYRVRGAPSMQQIKQLTIGLRNLGEARLDSGQVWVDELRLEDARNDAGLAAFAKLNTQLADFMNVQTAIDWQHEDFRTLSNTGRNDSDLKTNVSTNTNLHQFTPGRWGLNVPFKASFDRTLSLPRFGPNSDVELNKSEKDALRSLNTKQAYEFSFSKRAGRNWFWRWTLDQMNLRMSYTRNRRSNPTTPVDNQDLRNMSFSYKAPLTKKDLPFLKWLPASLTPQSLRQTRLRYLPSSLSYSMSANQQERQSLRRSDADTTFQETFVLKETFSSNVSPLTGLQGDYSLKLDRDLRKKFDLAQLSFGREVGRDQKGRVKYSMRFIKWLDQTYEFQAQYAEDNDPTQRLTQVVVDSTTGAPIPTRDINTKNDFSARFGLKLPALLRSIGKPGGKKQGEGETGGPFILWRLFHWSGGFMDNVNATWRRNITTRNFNLTGRPSLAYQLGLEDSLEVPRAAVGLTQQDQWSRTRDLDGSGGLKLPFGFGVKAKFREKFIRRTGSNQSRIRAEESTTFPGLSVSWGRAHRIPLVKKVLNSSNINVNYEKIKSRDGEVLRRSETLSRRNLVSRSESTDLRVSWSGKAVIGPALNIARNLTRGTDLDFDLVASADSSQVEDVERPLRGSTSSRKTSTKVSTNYSMRPRSLPVFGKLKSQINFKFEFSTETEIRKSATGDAKREPVADTGKWDFSIRGDYKFSSLFTGRGQFRMEKNHNNITDKTRNVVEIRMVGTMTFR